MVRYQPFSRTCSEYSRIDLVWKIKKSKYVTVPCGIPVMGYIFRPTAKLTAFLFVVLECLLFLLFYFFFFPILFFCLLNRFLREEMDVYNKKRRKKVRIKMTGSFIRLYLFALFHLTWVIVTKME